MQDPGLVLVGLLAECVDGLVWGVAAFTVYRTLGGPPRAWLAVGLVAGALFVVWDQWIFARLVAMAGFLDAEATLDTRRALEMGLEVAATVAGVAAGAALLRRRFGAG